VEQEEIPFVASSETTRTKTKMGRSKSVGFGCALFLLGWRRRRREDFDRDE
jgi:hypothetical protein